MPRQHPCSIMLPSVALRCGRVDSIIQLVLEYGADVDARDDGERSQLHLASDGGHAEAARILPRTPRR